MHAEFGHTETFLAEDPIRYKWGTALDKSVDEALDILVKRVG